MTVVRRGNRQRGHSELYCPQCGPLVYPPLDGVLCPFCGEKLRPNSYCQVCEATWPLPADTPCPKHDLPLVTGQSPVGFPVPAPTTDQAPTPAPTSPAASQSPQWTTIKVFTQPAEAQACRLLLESQGILTFLANERMSTNITNNVVLGGAKLQVPREQVDDARVILDQCWSLPKHDGPLGEIETEDEWDSLAPEPWIRRKRVMKAVIVLLLAGPVLLFLVDLVAVNFLR